MEKKLEKLKVKYGFSLDLLHAIDNVSACMVSCAEQAFQEREESLNKKEANLSEKARRLNRKEEDFWSREQEWQRVHADCRYFFREGYFL
jgi:uncharacterized protein (DUF3084 family)